MTPHPIPRIPDFCARKAAAVVASEAGPPSFSMSPPLRVSVVISHYNRPALLRRAIDTGLAQGDVVAEVIVVDDGSTPPLEAELMQRYAAGGKVEFILSPANRGAPHARNVGIDRARHPFIALLDCDDEWLAGKIERQLRHLLDHGLDICSTRFDSVGAGGVRRREPRPKYAGDPGRFILNDGGHMQTSTLLMRSETARAVRFDETLIKFQDWDFVIRAHARGFRLGLVDEVLTLYDSGHGEPRMTATLNPVYAEWFVRARRDIVTRKVAHIFLMRRVTQMYLQLGNRRESLRCAVRAIADFRYLSPFHFLNFIRHFLVD